MQDHIDLYQTSFSAWGLLLWRFSCFLDRYFRICRTDH